MSRTTPPFAFALFGAGRIGQVHGLNIAAHRDATLRYIVDPAAGPAQELAARTGATCVDEHTALDDATIDAIVVASATSTHVDLIERGIAAGKAVFCEKPIHQSLARVDACLAAIAGTPHPLLVGFNRRFDPGIAEMRRRITAGVIGRVELVTVISKDPGALPIEYHRQSGGLFRDLSIHDFDMARFMLGEEPVTVSATAATLTDPELAAIGDIDTASVTFQTASGSIATILNSRRATFGYDQRVEVHGSLGALRTENVAQHMLVQERDDGVVRAKPQFFFIERYADSYRLELEHFVRVLQGAEPVSPTGVDGRRALLLAEAAYESLATGRRVEIQGE
jgi:myo-inositol 2-dehydrogenase/D-chiro-inositol 1-dehydrogenase